MTFQFLFFQQTTPFHSGDNNGTLSDRPKNHFTSLLVFGDGQDALALVKPSESVLAHLPSGTPDIVPLSNHILLGQNPAL